MEHQAEPPQTQQRVQLEGYLGVAVWAFLMFIIFLDYAVVDNAFLHVGIRHLSGREVLLEIVLCGLVLPLLLGRFWKMPIKTTLRGSVLTTYSLLGRRTVDLSRLAAAQQSLYETLHALRLYTLKFTDASGGTAYIYLGTIGSRQREALWYAIRPYIFSNPAVQITDSEGVARTFESWAPKSFKKPDES